MADEHDKWLDRDAAERVLRGEPLEAVADDDARRAGRLAGTLDALSALPTGADGELPGEEAALKAFREARAESAVDAAVTSVTSLAHEGAAAGPAGTRLWGRPVRFGFVAAVAVCMVGGVAVAAGTGVLPSPFGGRDEPVPASSISAAGSEQPLATGSPSPEGGGAETPEGSVSPGSGSTGPDRTEPAPTDKGTSRAPGPRPSEKGRLAEALRRELTKGCVKYRGGRLTPSERQRLRDSAERYGRGPADIARICDRVLGEGGDGGGYGDDDGRNPGSEGHNGGQDGDEDNESHGSGNGHGSGGGNGNGNGHGSGGGYGFGTNSIHTGSTGNSGGDDGLDGGHTVKPGTIPSPDQSYSAAPQLPSASPSPSDSRGIETR
ncbi:hypothetical protein ABT127_14700 [Streptomyces sp. NPDC001904]|uniref:hypothetical protein n=1 Tax=Streptomyces sp. NPDC001904 TaxID=3154531 RepID=UPI003317E696